MDENNMITCPFCMETEFDAIGLKHHLLSGGCEMFNTTITIEEERRHLTSHSSRAAKARAIRDCQHIFKQPGCKGCWGISPSA